MSLLLKNIFRSLFNLQTRFIYYDTKFGFLPSRHLNPEGREGQMEIPEENKLSILCWLLLMKCISLLEVWLNKISLKSILAYVLASIYCFALFGECRSKDLAGCLNQPIIIIGGQGFTPRFCLPKKKYHSI